MRVYFMFKNKFFSSLIKYTGLSLIVVAVSLAHINGLNPFGAGAYLGMVFSGANALALIPALVAGAAVSGSHWLYIAASALIGVISVGFQYILKKFRKSPSVAAMIVLSLAAACAPCAVDLTLGAQPAYVIVNACLYLIFTYICHGIFKPLLYYSMKHSLADTEKACLYIVVVACSMGLSDLNVTGDIPLFLAVGLFLPLACRFVGKGAGVMTALAMGLGNAFATYNVNTVALFGFMALACCMFISSPKILAPLAQVFATVIFELFFEVDYLNLGYQAAALAAGGLIYAVLPEKFISAVKEKFFGSHSGAAVRHIINRNRCDLAKRARSVGEVFGEMSGILGGMEKTSTASVARIAKEVTASVCMTCERYAECKGEGLEEGMFHLAEKTFEKGKASMSDLPYLLVDKCLNIGKIMSLCTRKVSSLDMTVQSMENDNKVTKLLAYEFDGVSEILKGMSENAARPVRYDERLEQKIIEELKYYNIVCSEALMCLGDSPCATLIIRSECAHERKLIASVVGKCTGGKFYVKSVDDSAIAGWSVMDLEASPVYDVTFGVASRPLKSDAIGDTHSFMKIHGDKFLMAVCDGMGSGRRAYDLSNKAMSLVEGFYRAGFGHEITVDGINRFLGIEQGESFSALDIAVCDLSKGTADLVKLAAPASFVKMGDSVTAIDSSSLPLGVVGDAKPFVKTVDIEDGSAIVIASDGVTGRFSEGELECIINNTSTVNPQLAADEILRKATEVRSALEDDMTVAVCRIFKRA